MKRFFQLFFCLLLIVTARAEMPTATTNTRLTCGCLQGQTTMTNGTFWYATNLAVFTYSGTTCVTSSVSTDGGAISIMTPVGLTSDVQYPLEVSFMFTGKAFEIRGFGGGTTSIGNGTDVLYNVSVGAGESSWPHYQRIEFTNGGAHRIRLVVDSIAAFSGINIQQGDSITNISSPQKKVIVLSDSYGTGYIGDFGNALWPVSYPCQLASMVTNIEVIPSAAGGTGIEIPTSTYPKTNYPGRFVHDVVSNTPDWLVIQMSLNDASTNTASPLNYSNACYNLFTNAKAIYGTNFVILGQPMRYGYAASSCGDQADYVALNVSAKAIAALAGVPYFDAQASNVLNCSTDFGGDGVHPNQLGYQHLAVFLNQMMSKQYGAAWTNYGGTNASSSSSPSLNTLVNATFRNTVFR